MKKRIVWIGLALVTAMAAFGMRRHAEAWWYRHFSMHAQAAAAYYKFHRFDVYLTGLRQNINISYLRAVSDLKAGNTNAYAVDYSNAEYYTYALEHAKW